MSRFLIPYASEAALGAAQLAVGELVFDTTNRALKVGDGSTPAGIAVGGSGVPGGTTIIPTLIAGQDSGPILNAAMLAAELTGLEVAIPAGTWTILTPVVLRSGVAVRSMGRAILKAHANLPAGSPMVLMAAQSAGTGTFAQKAVSLDGITFDGNGRVGTDFLVKLYSVDGLSIRNCRFQNYKWGMVGIGGCRNVYVWGNSFTGWGNPSVSTEGGPALWVAGNLSAGDDTPTSAVRITDNDFFSGQWVAIYLFARDFSVKGNTIRSTMEGGIYGQSAGHAGASSPADSATLTGVISGNTISGVTRKYIAAAGIEVGGSALIIEGNVISATDDAGIKLNWSALDVNVLNNTVFDTVRASGADAGWTTFDTYGQITVIQADGSLVQDVTIRGNKIGQRGVTPIAAYGIKLHTLGANGVNHMDAIDVDRNDLRFGYANSAIGFLGTPIADNDPNSRIRDNLGHASEHPVARMVQLPATAGLTTINVGFPPACIRSTLVSQSATSSDTAFGVFTRGATVLGAANQGVLVTHGSATNHRGAAVGGAILRLKDDTGADVWAAQLVTITQTGFVLNVFQIGLSPGPWATFECFS